MLVGDRAPQRLDPFAGLVYGTFAGRPQPVRHVLRAAYEAPAHPTEWPDVLPSASTAGEVCVVLGEDGDVQLATAPGGGADPHGVPTGVSAVSVDPTGGGWVRPASRPDGAAYVVDNRGLLHRVADESVPALGYADVEPTVVPDAWLALLDDGVPLSEQEALEGG